MKIESTATTGVLEAQGSTPGRVAAWMARRVEVAVADVGLTLPQYRVLTLLGALGETASSPAHASELADRLAVRRPTITAVIDGLVAKGLVERRPVAGDRRRAELCLTGAGRVALGDADGAVEDKLETILGALDDPEDRRRATKGLEAWGRALARSGRTSFAAPGPSTGTAVVAPAAVGRQESRGSEGRTR